MQETIMPEGDGPPREGSGSLSEILAAQLRVSLDILVVLVVKGLVDKNEIVEHYRGLAQEAANDRSSAEVIYNEVIKAVSAV